MSMKKSFVIATRILFLCLILLAGLFGIIGTNGGSTKHGAMKVAVGPNGPWILTNDGAIYEHNGSGWDQIEAPGTADDFEVCGQYLNILTRPLITFQNHTGYTVKSRKISENNWTTYPPIGQLGAERITCYGDVPVVITTAPDMSVYKYNKNSQSWDKIHSGAKEISVENSRLFHLYPTTTNGNVWSRNIGGGNYTRWGENLVAHKIAGDANGYPWVATDATSNPLYKWDNTYQKWTFGFNSGPVYEMDIQSYIRMYILSDPQISGGGYTLYSHELYSGGWTTYSLPSY